MLTDAESREIVEILKDPEPEFVADPVVLACKHPREEGEDLCDDPEAWTCVMCGSLFIEKPKAA